MDTKVRPHWHRLDVSAILILLALSFLFCAGCGSQPAKQTVDRVRSEVATILKKDAAQIDVTTPLVTQGADELDIVEIVMDSRRSNDGD